MIQPLFNAMITIMMAKFLLNDVPHAAGFMFSNPSNPGSSTSDIIARTGMKEYEYHYFPEPEVSSKSRAYMYTRTKQIGQYEIRLTRTKSACSIKLYEFLEGWKKKLRATWTGLDMAECNTKFEQIAGVVRQARFEQKSAMKRRT